MLPITQEQIDRCNKPAQPLRGVVPEEVIPDSFPKPSPKKKAPLINPPLSAWDWLFGVGGLLVLIVWLLFH